MNLSALFDIGNTALKLIPDGKTRAEKAVKLKEAMASENEDLLGAAVQEMFSQISLNELDSKKGAFFAGARPFILWTAGAGLATPVLAWYLNAVQSVLVAFNLVETTVPLQGIDNPAIYAGLAASGIGLGVMRTIDKIKGTQTDNL